MEENLQPSFEILKHDRVSYLKEMKQLANRLLEENKTADGWKAKCEKDVIENNVLQLKEFIRQLNIDLHPLNVERYASHKLAMLTEFPDRIRPTNTPTFSQNVSISGRSADAFAPLTREIFGLEVTESGFYQLLKKAVAEFDDFDELLDHFVKN